MLHRRFLRRPRPRHRLPRPARHPRRRQPAAQPQPGQAGQRGDADLRHVRRRGRLRLPGRPARQERCRRRHHRRRTGPLHPVRLEPRPGRTRQLRGRRGRPGPLHHPDRPVRLLTTRATETPERRSRKPPGHRRRRPWGTGSGTPRHRGRGIGHRPWNHVGGVGCWPRKLPGIGLGALRALALESPPVPVSAPEAAGHLPRNPPAPAAEAIGRQPRKLPSTSPRISRAPAPEPLEHSLDPAGHWPRNLPNTRRRFRRAPAPESPEHPPQSPPDTTPETPEHRPASRRPCATPIRPRPPRPAHHAPATPPPPFGRAVVVSWTFGVATLSQCWPWHSPSICVGVGCSGWSVPRSSRSAGRPPVRCPWRICRRPPRPRRRQGWSRCTSASCC
ncbi:conserved hypothetical protein [Streptomyces murinus]